MYPQRVRNEGRIEPETAIHAQVSAAREGRDPRVIARLFSGWAVFGEKQFLRGYAYQGGGGRSGSGRGCSAACVGGLRVQRVERGAKVVPAYPPRERD